MSTAHLPKFARDLLNDCPTAGGGVHRWLFQVARVLHRSYADKDELFNLLKAASSDCGREVIDSEILDAIQNSERYAWRPGKKFGENQPRKPAWPVRDYARIESLGRGGPLLASISESSPVGFHGAARATEEVIDTLFPNDPLLCCGRSVRLFNTRRREEWRSFMSRLALIVPSPMATLTGQTQSGKKSRRCLNNTGPRKFLVIEFDFKEKDKNGHDTTDATLLRSLAALGRSVADLCAALHYELAKYAPLALLVHSGGKSLHGWYYAEGQSEEKLRRFMRYAVSIGADPATWTPCQFVRMPDGTRDNRQRQQVHFFNPAVIV